MTKVQEKAFSEFWDTRKTKPLPYPFCGHDSESLILHSRAGNKSPHNPYYYIKCDVCRASSGAYANLEALYTHWQTRNEVCTDA